MKSIIVKKCKPHRTFMRWLFLTVWFITGALSWSLRELDLGILLYIPAALIFSPLYIYFENWSLTFSREGIELEQWGHRRYSWIDITEVIASRSTAEEEDIRIRFQDGRELRFRMLDENAEKAVRMIQSHRSIVMK